MINKINEMMAEIQSLTAKSAEEVEQIRIKYLSKKGAITALMNDFRSVPPELKREVGQKLNALKTMAGEKLASLRESLATDAEAAIGDIDLTRTATQLPLGTRHPLSIVKNEIFQIFGAMGFTISEGPEIEDDWHVFSSLNFPPDHPARDMQDTFFISRSPQDILLRTHTSGACLPQRSHIRTCTLLLPSGGRPVYRPQCLIRRP